MELNADGTLSLPAMTLTAQQLDELLPELAKARSKMEPEVSKAFTVDSQARVLHQPAPDAFVKRTAGGEVSLILRHRGYGWLIYTFEPDIAAQLQQAIAAAVVHRPGEQVGGGDLH